MTILTLAIPTVAAPQSLFTSLDICRSQIESLGLESKVEILVSVNNLQTIQSDVISKIATRSKVVRNFGEADYDSHIDFLVHSANGEFVKILADDDFLEEGALSELMRAIGDLPAADFFYHEFILGDQQNSLHRSLPSFELQRSSLSSVRTSISWGQVSSVMFRKSAWTQIASTERTNYIHIYKLLFNLFSKKSPKLAHTDAKLVRVTPGSPNFSKSAFQRVQIALSGLRVHKLLDLKFPFRLANLLLANRQMALLSRILAHSKVVEVGFSSRPFIVAIRWFPFLPATVFLVIVAMCPAFFLRLVRNLAAWSSSRASSSESRKVA
ncbi:MAG: hypothetical protein RL460_274 [Actinomycetota bacterium]|jgi:hypothetical protein